MQQQKKTICLVINSLQAGGMERVMSELAHYFAAKPYLNVHLVLYGVKRDIFYSIPSNIIIHKPAFEFNTSKRLVSSIRTMYFLRKKLSALQADAIVSFGEYWNSMVLLSCIGLKLPIYVSDRCQPDKYLGKVQEFLRTWLYPNANGIIAQTEIAKNRYLQKIKQPNVQVIGNPIRMIENKLQQEKENIVLTVGRLITSKHHDKLIELFVRINQPGWKLIIIGDDALKQNNMVRLQKMVGDLAANDKVLLTGKLSNVEEYYCKSKIFAFTSSSEGFPNVIGEAQSAGLPVIAFDCVAGPAEMLIDGENGFLIPLFDYAMFENKLAQLMQDTELRNTFGEKAKQTIRKFSVDEICNRFENFILN